MCGRQAVVNNMTNCIVCSSCMLYKITANIVDTNVLISCYYMPTCVCVYVCVCFIFLHFWGSLFLVFW